MNWKTIDNPLFVFEQNDAFAKFHFSFATKCPPAQLFHYTSSDSLLAIINSQCMLATERSCLNDPQEFQWGLDAFQEHLNSERSKRFPADVIEQARIALAEKAQDDLRLFVLSLSANPDLLSQWRAYATEGTGFAVGLDGGVLRDRAGFGEYVLRNIDPNRLPKDCVFSYHLLPVVYERHLQQEMLDGFLDAASVFWKSKDRHDQASQKVFRLLFQHRANELLISLKNPGYKEEREWRMVATVHKNSETIQYRNGRFGITPYVRFNLSRRDDLPEFRLPITTLWAGPNSPAKRNARGINMLLESKGLGIALLFSEIEYRT